MTSEDIRKISMEQSAIDMNCCADDFKQLKNKVVISKFKEGSKKCFKYYCTAWSNIASKNNEIASGYKTAWVELTAIDTDKALELVNY